MLTDALTIFLSALLLFLVEPLVGKAVLPWFGGAPAVWTTCLLFFQTMLLAGYVYAHALATRLSPRAQRAVHLTLLAVSLAALALGAVFSRAPILPAAALRPPDASAPVARVLLALAAAVGLPFFALSTTGPLLQAWIARRTPQARIFRLYALSNLGSLLGLVAYPFLVEPALSLTLQARVWSIGYGVFAAGAAVAAKRAGQLAATEVTAETEPRARHGARVFWFVLSACGSALLLATTNQLCQEVAAIPFLWVFPLALYLFTFILCFQSDRVYRRWIFGPLLLFALAWSAVTLNRGYVVDLRTQIASYGLVLFAACMTLHGELARSRPEAREATGFYLAIAAGGAAGAVFVALIAPLVFPAFWEFHLLLWLSGGAAVAALLSDPASWVRRGSPYGGLAALLAMAALAWHIRNPDLFDDVVRPAKVWLATPLHALAAAAVLVGGALLIRSFPAAVRVRGRPYLAGTALAGALGFLMIALSAEIKAYRRGAVALSRNFYGVLTLEALDSPDPQLARLSLRHGRIVHGFQYQAPEKRRIPTTYYGEGTGIALAIEGRRRAAGGMRVGVVGLGTGTLAAYGRAGDVYRFYDINPAVVELSTSPRPRFTYVADSPARVEIVMGDARLSMERELARAQPQRYDVLAIDAFTSDAIPVHLLTREALAVYAAHLARPDGILAVHVSNRQLDLKPVVREGAAALALSATLVDTNDSGEAVWGATWILLSRGRHALEAPMIAKAAGALPKEPRVRLWTDDYSNLFQVLK